MNEYQTFLIEIIVKVKLFEDKFNKPPSEYNLSEMLTETLSNDYDVKITFPTREESKLGIILEEKK